MTERRLFLAEDVEVEDEDDGFGTGRPDLKASFSSSKDSTIFCSRLSSRSRSIFSCFLLSLKALEARVPLDGSVEVGRRPLAILDVIELWFE